MENTLPLSSPPLLPRGLMRTIAFALAVLAAFALFSEDGCDDRDKVDHLGDPIPRHWFSEPSGGVR